MKQIIYLFVARDSDMIVFEQHVDKQVQLAKFSAEIFEELTLQQNEDIEGKQQNNSKDLFVDDLKLHTHFDVIYYGLVANNSLQEEKAFRLISDLKNEVVKMYKGNVDFIFKQTNVERNCLGKFLTPKVSKLVENYTSSISSKNLNAAFQKVDEVKSIAGRTIGKMQENMAQSEELLKNSQEVQFLAKDFQKNSE